MDSAANKQTVTRFNIEVIQQGRREAFEALMAPDFVNWSAPPQARGAEGMWNTFENVLRPALSGLKVVIHEQLCEGDKVTTRKSITGVHSGPLMGVAPTGRAVSIDAIDIVRVTDGQYREHWGVNNLAAVVAALRIPPHPDRAGT